MKKVEEINEVQEKGFTQADVDRKLKQYGEHTKNATSRLEIEITMNANDEAIVDMSLQGDDTEIARVLYNIMCDREELYYTIADIPSRVRLANVAFTKEEMKENEVEMLESVTETVKNTNLKNTDDFTPKVQTFYLAGTKISDGDRDGIKAGALVTSSHAVIGAAMLYLAMTHERFNGILCEAIDRAILRKGFPTDPRNGFNSFMEVMMDKAMSKSEKSSGASKLAGLIARVKASRDAIKDHHDCDNCDQTDECALPMNTKRKEEAPLPGEGGEA